MIGQLIENWCNQVAIMCSYFFFTWQRYLRSMRFKIVYQSINQNCRQFNLFQLRRYQEIDKYTKVACFKFCFFFVLSIDEYWTGIPKYMCLRYIFAVNFTFSRLRIVQFTFLFGIQRWRSPSQHTVRDRKDVVFWIIENSVVYLCKNHEWTLNTSKNIFLSIWTNKNNKRKTVHRLRTRRCRLSNQTTTKRVSYRFAERKIHLFVFFFGATHEEHVAKVFIVWVPIQCDSDKSVAYDADWNGCQQYDDM